MSTKKVTHIGLGAMIVAVLCAAMMLAQPATADVFTNVPESAGYSLMYTLPLPTANAAFQGGTPVPYSVNNSAVKGPAQHYDRIAYYLELDVDGPGAAPFQYAYASMNAFDFKASRIGLPHNSNNPVARQQVVTDMNVFSNVGTVTTGTGIATGSIEMWPSNYGTPTTGYIGSGSGSTYDFNDNGFGTGSGYGSFQVHNFGAAQTVLAYNAWGGGNADDVGIGNRPTSHPDWTFAGNAAGTLVKNLQILVRPSALPTGPASLIANAPEAATYSVVYQLPIQNGAFNTSQYVQDNSAAFVDGSFDRVGYYLELQSATFGSQFVFVSADSFTAQADQLGVPRTTTFQQFLSNMNVVSNVGSIVNGTGIATGNIEFWNTNYSGTNSLPVPGAAGNFDFGDQPTAGGYGSMQIHNYGAMQTLFAFNNFNNGSTHDLGIGNQPSGNPDWTFANNVGTYSVKNLWVLAHIDGAVLDATPVPGSILDFGDAIPQNTEVLMMSAVALSNIGVTNSMINVTGFAITGPDSAFFDVPGFAPALLTAGFDDTIAYDVTFLGGLQGEYDAVLTFFTNEGNVTYDLSAIVVIPEPVTAGLIGLASMAVLLRRRRRTV